MCCNILCAKIIKIHLLNVIFLFFIICKIIFSFSTIFQQYYPICFHILSIIPFFLITRMDSYSRNYEISLCYCKSIILSQLAHVCCGNLDYDE